jgi:hypothetical protein
MGLGAQASGDRCFFAKREGCTMHVLSGGYGTWDMELSLMGLGKPLGFTERQWGLPLLSPLYAHAQYFLVSGFW